MLFLSEPFDFNRKENAHINEIHISSCQTFAPSHETVEHLTLFYSGKKLAFYQTKVTKAARGAHQTPSTQLVGIHQEYSWKTKELGI